MSDLERFLLDWIKEDYEEGEFNQDAAAADVKGMAVNLEKILNGEDTGSPIKNENIRDYLSKL